MTSQKIPDRLGLMRAQVIADDVNGSLRSLAGDEIFQKGDELCTGVAGAGLADDLPAPGLKGCIERERSMAIIFKAVSFRPTGRERQDGVQTIQRLDGTLFVDTEHCGVQRRFEVQADDIGRLLFKFRIGTGHIAAQSMGLDPGPSPHPSHPAVRNTQIPCQLSGAPMSRSIGRRLLSRFQNSGLQGNDLLRDNLATMSGIQTRQAFFNKTLFPPSNEHLAAAFLFHNGSIRLSGSPGEGSPSRAALLLLSSFGRLPFFSVPAAHAAPISTVLLPPTKLNK